ncbi:hypothetical protein HHI36_001864 [Cryptolaemus montrouzieri]|uniref:Uncharacterized protein n=1 Tax=Cryptolaemus montrouzieri TaxID=559131 RepID=A0ABD2P9N6_9CUCU
MCSNKNINIKNEGIISCLGKVRNDNEDRPILVKLSSEKQRECLMLHKKRFVNTKAAGYAYRLCGMDTDWVQEVKTCIYSDTDEVGRIFEREGKHLNIIHFNIPSLIRNHDELMVYLHLLGYEN